MCLIKIICQNNCIFKSFEQAFIFYSRYSWIIFRVSYPTFYAKTLSIATILYVVYKRLYFMSVLQALFNHSLNCKLFKYFNIRSNIHRFVVRYLSIRLTKYWRLTVILSTKQNQEVTFFGNNFGTAAKTGWKKVLLLIYPFILSSF